jgi:hypothetical protein
VVGRNDRWQTPGTNGLDHLPPRNLHQPRPKTGPITQPCQPPKGPQERVLCNVLRSVDIVQLR